MVSCHDARYCQQWNVAPTRYDSDGCALSFQSQCGYPTTWTVKGNAPGGQLVDSACDVHLSQAVRRIVTEHPVPTVQVIPFTLEK
jgi:hypothetical protein